MSGIGGVRAFSAGAFTATTLQEMAEALRHRGPDGSSTWVGADVGLAHTRLATLGDEHAHQPMHSVDGRWVLAFDGEIVNHESLRAHLDYPFRSRGDSEVVVAGLALEGISFVDRMRGPFALLAHDIRTDTTHLVRDRLGILPLYYRHVPGGIAFASEIKALLALGPPPAVDGRSLDAYLTSRTVPAPDTMFEGVKKVRPAHRLSVMPRGRIEEARYWTLPEGDPEGAWTMGDAIEAVSDGMREAVRAALVADVPVGAHLTGALGSSLVVAEMMQQHQGEVPVHTFSVGFDGQSRDDLSWARRVSHLMGTEHHEVVLGVADFEDVWNRSTWHRDAPISEPADLATYALAHAAREHVRVVLTGEGADELFGEQPKWRLARLAERTTVLPTSLRSRVRGPVERRLGAAFTSAERQRLLGSEPPRERLGSHALGTDPVDRRSRDDLQHRFPDHVLERGDRLSMASSVAWRPALLDHRLVELAFRLPTSLKTRQGAPGWVLKEVARPLLPDEVVDHRRAGSELSLDLWLSRGLRTIARDRLTGAGSWVGSTLDRAFVRALVEGHDRGDHDDVRLWTLLSLEVWHACFFGTPPTAPRPRQETPVASVPSPAPRA